MRLDAAEPGRALSDLYEALLDDDSVRMHAAPEMLAPAPEPGRMSISVPDALALFIAANDAVELARRIGRVVERWRLRHERTVTSIAVTRGVETVSIPLDSLTAERFGTLIEQLAAAPHALTADTADNASTTETTDRGAGDADAAS